MNPLRLLLVEDDDDQRLVVAGILRGEGHQVTAVDSVEKALHHLGDHGVDLIVSDWKLPGLSGLDLLRQVKENYPDIAFIMVTAYGTIHRAVEAVRAGADNYLTKPYAREALLLALEQAHKHYHLTKENRRLSKELGDRARLVDLIGRSNQMQRLYRKVDKLAATNATVLITGESGTGKELTARALHELSTRKPRPFIAVNCGSIPENLVEAAFFGNERGAFTGADRARNGYFQAAHGGTLFLDEIGELPKTMQPKLLRVLQESRITKVGGVTELAVDVRIIAATNRDLVDDIQQGLFREDLYYRLNVVPIQLPPLRARGEDIPLLITHFLKTHADKHGLPQPELDADARRKLLNHHWPGNVRELSNVLERLILLADEGRITTDDLPMEIGKPSTPQTAAGFQVPETGMCWELHEKSCLQQAMERAEGNRRKAAKLLNLSYKTFLYRLDKHGI